MTESKAVPEMLRIDKPGPQMMRMVKRCKELSGAKSYREVITLALVHYLNFLMNQYDSLADAEPAHEEEAPGQEEYNNRAIR